ncbi:hypothetical protein AMTR_s00005p00220590, partial [Amborella trichopoda]
STKSVAVVGGGVSGLTTAYRLKSHGLNVTLYESEGTAGGRIRSIAYGGLIWEEGANTMTESEMEVKRLIDDLGLREKQQFPISQNKRFIARNGTPVLIPSNPLALFGSKLLSPHSKLRVILEPLFWRSSNRKGDISKVSDQNLQESVGDFFQRHFGQEVVDYLVDPFVAGTSAADPNSLSVQVTSMSEICQNYLQYLGWSQGPSSQLMTLTLSPSSVIDQMLSERMVTFLQVMLSPLLM